MTSNLDYRHQTNCSVVSLITVILAIWYASLYAHAFSGYPLQTRCHHQQPTRYERCGFRSRINPIHRYHHVSHRKLCSSPSSRDIKDENENSQRVSPTETRRDWIQTQIRLGMSVLPVVSFASVMCRDPAPAWAKYGDSTSMELPNYIDYLIEKNRQVDDSEVLYRGADPAVLLGRLQESLKRLNEVPVLASEKKWTQINGLVTGPLGTLSQTLNQIVTIASASATPSSGKKSNTSKVQDAARKVKADVLAIGQAADKKDADSCTKQAALASQDLKTLLEIAFD